MELIGISPRFFKHELNNYSDWEKAFWRELVQNSVDEKCTKIDITISQKEEVCHIRFEDNGPGMSEETMRNVYFQLGETGKENSDAIGGHGRARLLTCFAHDSYEIRTRNLFCQGQGGSFAIDNSQPNFKGCSVSVTISSASVEKMTESLHEYLSTCQLPCETLVNGKAFTNWLYKRKATRKLTFGTVHTTKHKEYTSIIRVRGVTMFERYVGCKTGAIIEIDPSNSLAVLTVSRDQLKYNHQYELNAFISEISIDNKSLTRDCAVNKTEIYGEFKRIGKNPSHMPEENSKVLLPQATITGTSETKWYSDSGSVCGEGQALVTSTPHAFSVHYEDAPKKMGRAARQFHKDKIKGNRLKLLLAWNETIQFFLETLYDIYNEEVIYLPGFVFGVDISGLHKSEKLEKEEGHIIYLNPIDINGRIAISHKDTERLYAIGAHELAHIRCTYHDEYYAGVLTLLMERTVAKLPELKARIKKAVKQINPP